MAIRITITVTEEDIENGEQNNEFADPVALAIERVLSNPGNRSPMIRYGFMPIHFDTVHSGLPKIAYEFIEVFNRYGKEKVKPIKFNILLFQFMKPPEETPKKKPPQIIRKRYDTFRNKAALQIENKRRKFVVRLHTLGFRLVDEFQSPRYRNPDIRDYEIELRWRKESARWEAHVTEFLREGRREIVVSAGDVFWWNKPGAFEQYLGFRFSAAEIITDKQED